MASKSKAAQTDPAKRGKAYTPPKGRATVASNQVVQTRRISPTMEWVIAGIVLVAVIAAIFYFGNDFRASGGGGHGGI